MKGKAGNGTGLLCCNAMKSFMDISVNIWWCQSRGWVLQAQGVVGTRGWPIALVVKEERQVSLAGKSCQKVFVCPGDLCWTIEAERGEDFFWSWIAPDKAETLHGRRECWSSALHEGQVQETVLLKPSLSSHNHLKWNSKWLILHKMLLSYVIISLVTM